MTKLVRIGAVALVVAMVLTGCPDAGLDGSGGDDGTVDDGSGTGDGAIPTDGLVAFYTMDYPADDTTVADSGPNGWDGTLSGGVSASPDRDGTPGGALEFNGTDGEVSASGGPFSGVDALTLSLWFLKPDDTTTNGQIAYVKETSGGYNLVASGTTLTFEIFGPGDSLDSVSGSFGSVGAWVHVIATFDGATIDLYLNDTPVDSTAFASTMTADGTTLAIGRRSSIFWKGRLDDIRIYDRVLTAAERTALANE